jgi:hypothetical protein
VNGGTNPTTVVNVTNINVYKNTTVEHAVVAVREDRFGRGGNVQQARIAHVDARRLEPARTPIRVHAGRIELRRRQWARASSAREHDLSRRGRHAGAASRGSAPR